MNRRSFFGSLLGALLCKFLPKPKVIPTRVDTLDMSRWGAELFPRGFCGVRLTSPKTRTENSLFCNLPAGHAGAHGWQSPWVTYPPDGCHQVSVHFVTRNGYITPASPPKNWTAHVNDIPLGPPNVVRRIVSFDD